MGLPIPINDRTWTQFARENDGNLFGNYRDFAKSAWKSPGFAPLPQRGFSVKNGQNRGLLPDPLLRNGLKVIDTPRGMVLGGPISLLIIGNRFFSLGY